MAEIGDGIVVIEATEIGLARPVQVTDLMQEWARQFDLWLSSSKRSNKNTVRSFRKSWESLLNFTGKMPWLITKSDVAEWVAGMTKSGLSDATVAQRVAAISSFYRYAMDEAEITLPDGRMVPLASKNPASGKSLRPSVNPYDKAEGMTAEQVTAFLRVIVPNTVQGLRDSALFRLYLATGRRNTEVRALRKCDIQERMNGIWFHWEQKRNQGMAEIPEDIWEDIQNYLRLAGRPWESLEAGDYIFTALDDCAKRLPNIGKKEDYDPTSQPLSDRQVLGLVKKYAKKAGLDPKLIHVHTIRHTTADMMREMSFDVMDIQDKLGHKHLNTTQIYLTKKHLKKDTFWKRFRALNLDE